MKIAVISDTHDNLKMTKRFIEDVSVYSPDYMIHLGDIVSPFVIPILSELAIPGIFVKGNNDGDTDYLGEMCYNSGFKFVIPPYKSKLAKKNIVITHRPLKSEKFDFTGVDYYLYGHTHFNEISRTDNMYIINPGTVSGFVSGKSTYIILDTISNDVTLRQL